MDPYVVHARPIMAPGRLASSITFVGQPDGFE